MTITSFASIVCILLTSLLFPRVGAHLVKTTSTLKNEESASRRLQGYGGEAVFTNETLKDAVRFWISDNESAVDVYGPIQDWDTSMVTDMSGLFYGTTFNGDISKWDISSVTGMRAIFNAATAFNGDISKWDVSKVTNMDVMFQEATAFNSDISEWDVSSVTSMSYMFNGARAFDGDIFKWDVSSVTSTYSMFRGATAFNGDISEWDVSSVTYMGFMFYGATAFEQILCWDLMRESQTDSMFDGSSGGLDPKCDTDSDESVGWAERQGVRLVVGMTLLVVALDF